MEFSIETWMDQYVEAVKKQFADRIWFIGLQGSYGRGEATDQSDIDVVLILNTLSARDLEDYGRVLDGLSERERICGFVSGKEELLAWEPSDLFQFYHDTTAVQGTLEELVQRIGKEDVRRAVRIGACNIYHMCVHNLVHEKSADILKSLFKSSVFTLQAAAYLQTGRYAKRKEELMALLEEKDQAVLTVAMELKTKETPAPGEFRKYSSLLLEWASEWMREVQNYG